MVNIAPVRGFANCGEKLFKKHKLNKTKKCKNAPTFQITQV